MKFKIYRASSFDVLIKEEEINTLEDLKEIIKGEECKSLVIDFGDSEIIIYDYWIE